MIPYVFHIALDASGGVKVLRDTLASDIEASVRSFDLMQRNPSWRSVVVSHDGAPILRRQRAGGKVTLVWGPGFPRAHQALFGDTRRRAAG